MDMKGEYHIPAPRDIVWAALNDPDVLRACIPGCDSLDMTSETEMHATVTAKVGPVKAKFKGEVTLSDIKPPESYKITGEGKGGVAGFAKGGADVRLLQDSAGTILQYEAKAQVGGKLAQLGSRLIDSTAKKFADEFFKTFSDHVTAQSQGNSAADQEDPETEPQPELGHDDTIADAAHEIAEAVHDVEQKLEMEAGKGTLGGPFMWGVIALVGLVALLLLINGIG